MDSSTIIAEQIEIYLVKDLGVNNDLKKFNLSNNDRARLPGTQFPFNK